MTRNSVTPRIIEENASGFSGTNSQWAARLGVPRQSTFVALQRLVVQGLIERDETAEGVVIYGKPSKAPKLNGRRIIVEVGRDGVLSAKWG